MNHETLQTIAVAAIAGLLACVGGTAMADGPGARQAGDILVRAGTHDIIPRSTTVPNLGTIDVESAWGFTFNVSYMFTPHWGVELLAAAPFEHEVKLAGSKVATVNHLPPTLSVQYHFAPASRFQPYLGAGVNYTLFFNEQTGGALAGTSLSLRSSVGFAAQAGLDYRINDHFFVNTEVRWIDINSDMRINGAKVTELQIDPVAVGLMVGWQF